MKKLTKKQNIQNESFFHIKPKYETKSYFLENSLEITSENIINNSLFKLKDFSIEKSKKLQEMESFSMVKDGANAIKCRIHSEDLTLFCLDDKELCCINCVHHEKEHKKHKIVSIKSVLDLILQDNKSFKNKLKEKLNYIDDSLRILKANDIFLQNSYSIYKEIISNEFNEIIYLTNKRMDHLNKEVDSYFNKLLGNIKEKLDNLSYLKKCFNDFKHLEVEKNLDYNIYMFSVQKMLKKTLSNLECKMKILNNEDMNSLNITSKELIKSEIENFGEFKKGRKAKNNFFHSKKKHFTRSQSSSCTHDNYIGILSEINNSNINLNGDNNLLTDSFQPKFNNNYNNGNRNKTTYKYYNNKLNTSEIIEKRNKFHSKNSSSPCKTLSNTFQVMNKIMEKNIEKNKEKNKEVDLKIFKADLSEKTFNSTQRSFNEKNCKFFENKKKNAGKSSTGSIDNSFLRARKSTNDFSEDYNSFFNKLYSVKNSRDFFIESTIFDRASYEVMPRNIKATKILYKYSLHGKGSKIFHEKCDFQNNLVFFIKTSISSFGFFIPIEIKSVEKYFTCDNCWIFSLQNKLLKPTKFEIKEDKKFISIYQSKKSPCLGSTIQGKQDLYIELIFIIIIIFYF